MNLYSINFMQSTQTPFICCGAVCRYVDWRGSCLGGSLNPSISPNQLGFATPRGGWNKFQTHSPKWWWKMKNGDLLHGTICKKSPLTNPRNGENPQFWGTQYMVWNQEYNDWDHIYRASSARFRGPVILMYSSTCEVEFQRVSRLASCELLWVYPLNMDPAKIR